MAALPGLEGRVCVVTGASRGAGRAIALVLGEAGGTVDAVRARGGTAIPVACDATDAEQVEYLGRAVLHLAADPDVLKAFRLPVTS